jgi:hypothetical protein
LDESDYNEKKNHEYYYTRTARLARTLSDSLLCSKKVTNIGGDEEYEFIKISSNFNEAMEEVNRQKQKIKQEYTAMMYKPSTSDTALTVEGVEEAIADIEVEKIQQSDRSSTNKSPVRSIGVDTKHVYFPKSKQKPNMKNMILK